MIKLLKRMNPSTKHNRGEGLPNKDITTRDPRAVLHILD